MCCMWLAGNAGPKNRQKLAIWAPSHNFVGLYLRNWGMCRQSEKLLNSNISPTCPHNTANFGPLTAEIGLGVWGTPANFNDFLVLVSLLQWRRSLEANKTLHDVWLSPGLVQIHFWGSYPVTEFFQVQNSPCVQVLRSPILTALLHGTPAAGVSQTLRHGTRNGITELSQRAPPIFGWAAITLGIGPYSSCYKSHVKMALIPSLYRKSCVVL